MTKMADHAWWWYEPDPEPEQEEDEEGLLEYLLRVQTDAKLEEEIRQDEADRR